jgi:bla regulator protein BlaR1
MNYIIEVTICWIVFYVFYMLFLQKETFFKANRIYLIVCLIMGLFLPFINLNAPNIEPVFVQTIQYSLDNINIPIEISESIFPSFQQVLWTIYIIGLLIFSSRLFYNIYLINDLLKNGVIINKPNYKLVISNENQPPFSFFNYLFISNSLLNQQEDSDKIIQHELAHIEGNHSLDVLLLELICILFWFNPMVYLYKKHLQDVHEYLADSEVTKHTSIKKYGHLLMRQALPSIQFALSNYFNHSQLKKRITMMTKKESSKWAYAKFAFVLPILAAMTIIFSAYNYPSTFSKNETGISQTDPIYKEVDEMPRYPGCEDITDKEERKNCSNKNLLTFVYTNVKYPKAAQKAGTEGMTVVSFVVGKDGQARDFKLVRDIENGCGAEALRTVKLLEAVKWIPGKKDGKDVNVAFNLPIKFKLAGEKKEDKK